MLRKPLKTVLYVDDEPDICAVVKATLSVIGHLSVHIATSGSRALELVGEVEPDLVLMDVMMPELDGPSTLARLREADRVAPIPVVFMTAKVLPSELARFLHLGALGVIRKPFNPLTLSNDLLAIWNGPHAAGAPHAKPGDPRDALLQTSSLTAAFLQRVSRDLLVLQRWMAPGHPTDRSRLPEMERLAHSINGAGAMFGFPGLSSAAAEVEHLLSDASASCSEEPALRDFPLFARLSERVDELAERATEAGCV